MSGRERPTPRKTRDDKPRNLKRAFPMPQSVFTHYPFCAVPPGGPTGAWALTEGAPGLGCLFPCFASARLGAWSIPNPNSAMPLPPSSHEPPGGKDFVKQSSLYQEFLAEREEILRHKWLESERLGYDIGFERALLDWIRKHRDNWRASRRSHPTLLPPPKAGDSRLKSSSQAKNPG